MRRTTLPWLMALVAVACGDAGADAPCTTPSAPAFRVVVRAPDTAELPGDTRVEVAHGGGVEVWSLGSAGTSRVVFCTPQRRDGSPDDVLAISCELWTEGAAEVTVAGGNYPPVEAALAAERASCGFETVEAAITLGEEDGGRL